MREIIFDTETTGTNPASGDRIVEIGCIELIDGVESGRRYHAYFNPERPMPSEAFAVHGLSDAFLADKPRFADAVDDLIAFLGQARLVAHNAGFDFGFLNAELARCGRDPVCYSRMVDTLAIARTRHPGAKHSLDALCIRYGVDRSHRVLHGALLDAELLAHVYIELNGGRQIGLGLDVAVVGEPGRIPVMAARIARAPRHFAPSAEEVARHRQFIARMAAPLWARQWAAAEPA